MAEDVIKVGIDDAELDMLIAKLKQSITLQSQMGMTGGLRRGTSDLMRDWRSLERSWTQLIVTSPSLLEKFGTADLPSINRNLRVILGQIPGMRQLIQYYFRIKWLQRGVGELVETGAMMPLVLTLWATAIIIIRQVLQLQKRLERERLQYEMDIREARGWTHEEFIKGTEDWEDYLRSLPG